MAAAAEVLAAAAAAAVAAVSTLLGMPEPDPGLVATLVLVGWAHTKMLSGS